MNSELLLSPFVAEGRSLRGTLSFVGTPSNKGFHGVSDGKESTCNVGDLGLIPGLGRSPGEGNGYPLQYSCLENPHGQRSLAGYGPWGWEESDATEQLSTTLHITQGLLKQCSCLFSFFEIFFFDVVHLKPLFIYFWLHWVFVAACGSFSSGEQGLLFVVKHSLLIVVASLAVELGL